MKFKERLQKAWKLLCRKDWFINQLTSNANNEIEKYRKETWDEAMNKIQNFVMDLEHKERMEYGIGNPNLGEHFHTIYLTSLDPDDRCMPISPLPYNETRYVSKTHCSRYSLRQGWEPFSKRVKKDLACALAEKMIEQGVVEFKACDIYGNPCGVAFDAYVNVFKKQ